MRALTLTWYQGTEKPELLTKGLIPGYDSGVLFVGSDGMLIADYGRHLLLPTGQFADELLLLSNGRRIAMGRPADVLTEHTISEHYGASVRVLHDECGGVVIVPTRSHREASGSPRAPAEADRADGRR